MAARDGRESVESLLEPSDDEEEEFAVAQAQAARRATRGIVPPPPPPDLLGQLTPPAAGTQATQYSQPLYNLNVGRPGPIQATQATLIPTQFSQMSNDPNAMGNEFNNLLRYAQQHYPSQTQGVAVAMPPATVAVRTQKKTAGDGKGRAAGSKNYSVEEKMNLLHIIQERLPIGPTQWSLVAEEHALTYPDNPRNVDSIRRQFHTLFRRREPTGDPNCPEEVKLAKQVNALLQAKQRAGLIGEANGGPAAFLANMEATAPNNGEAVDTSESSVANDGPSVAGSLPPVLIGAQGMVQKRPPRGAAGGTQPLIESMLAMQVLATQTAERERREEQKREARERRREKKERREMRLHEERRENMFLGLVGMGIAAFTGRNGGEGMDTTELISSLRATASTSKGNTDLSLSSSDDESVISPRKKARATGPTTNGSDDDEVRQV